MPGTLCLALLELLVAAQIHLADSALLPGGVGGHSLLAVELRRDVGRARKSLDAGPLGVLDAYLSRLGARNASAAVIAVEGESTAALEDGAEYDVLGPVECGVQFRKHPDKVACPSACPFIRMEIGGVCDMSCVAAPDCHAKNPVMNFANPQTMRCELCKVSACKQCGGSQRSCAQCQAGYTLGSDGECWGNDRWYWRAVYFLIFLAVLTVLAYVVTTMLRPAVPEARKVLEQALRFRDLSKTRDHNGRKYPLMTTDLKNEYISGVGVMLHFKFQHAAVLFALVIFILLWAVSNFVGSPPAIMEANPEDKAAFDICNAHIRVMVQEVSNMETIYFRAVLVIYALTTVASIAFAVHQRRFANRTSAVTTTMQDFCLTVRGLPKRPGTKPVEEDTKTYFQELLKDTGIDVIGVSICWDYRKNVAQLQDQLKHEMDQTEIEWERENGQMNTIREAESLRKEASRPSSRRPSGGSGTELFQQNSTFLRAKSAVKGVSWKADLVRRLQFLREVDNVFLSGDVEDDTVLPPEDMGPREIRALLETLLSSGKAYIVFESESDRDSAMVHLESLALENDGKPIKFQNEDIEPDTVMWQNSGTKDRDIFKAIVIGCVVMVFGVALLDILFYFPSIAYFLSVSEVAGMSDGGVQCMLLGMLVCICNQCIYLMIGTVADTCGFNDSDAHQQFYVVGYTAAVFINTIIDLFVVMLLAQGYSMDQAIHNTNNDGSSAMSTRAISESPGMQKAVYDQYWAYIFPSCLLIPFLLEPIAAEFIYKLKVKIVGSHPEVTAQEAELQLQCPPFDLARYGDILVNLMLCVGVMAFTYRDLHMLFGCLFISLGWLYVLDSFRFLRITTKGSFVSSKLDVTAQWLCSVPCGILAGCLAFRLCGGSSSDAQHVLDLMKDLPKELREGVDLTATTFQRDQIVVMIFLAFFAHIFVHGFILKRLVPRWSEVESDHQEIRYVEEAKRNPCNWFNANPVYCLRSKYIYQHSPPCNLFAPGKEFLLKANPDIGLHYENQVKAAVDEEDLTLEDLHAARASVKQKADEAYARGSEAYARFKSRRTSGSTGEGEDSDAEKAAPKEAIAEDVAEKEAAPRKDAP